MMFLYLLAHLVHVAPVHPLCLIHLPKCVDPGGPVRGLMP